MDVWMVVLLVVAASLLGAVPAFLLVRSRRRLRAARAAQERGSPTLEVLDHLVAGSLGLLVSRLEAARPDLAPALARDGTVTLLFSDIEGSTRLNRRLGDEPYAELLGAHDDLARRVVRRHGGQVVKTQGDGFMAAFRDPNRAVGCAVVLRRRLGDPREVGVALRVRVGIHTGQAVSRRRDYFGESVAFAARVAEAAEGGEILVSEAVRARLDPDGDVGIDRGRKVRLKGIPGRHRLHAVIGDHTG